MVRDKNENDEYDSKCWILTLSSILHVSDTFSRILTIHHSTQQRAEKRSINVSFLNIFEYQHFSCIKSHHAKPPRIGLSYLPQNTKSTTFCPSILNVSDIFFPRLHVLPFNAATRRELVHQCWMSQTSFITLPETPFKTPRRGSVKTLASDNSIRYTYIWNHTGTVQYQTAVALWPGWVPPKRYCNKMYIMLSCISCSHTILFVRISLLHFTFTVL